MTVTFMFQSFFFQFFCRVLVSMFIFVFFQFYSVVSRKSKVSDLVGPLYFIYFIFCCWLLQSLVVLLRLDDIYVSQNPKELVRLILQDRFWMNISFNFLHNSQWITFPIQSCLLLCSFCACLLHSLISSLSPYNLHLLLCCVLSILALIWLVLIVLFWAAITRDLVSLWRFPFCIHVHVFSFEMPHVSHLKYP